MIVYRYTLKKFLRTPSTWVLLVIGILTMFFLGGFLTFWLLGMHWDLKNSDQLKELSMKTAFIIDYTSPGTTLSLLIAVFAGIKGSQVFRDEIEDGSFLIVLSKPLSRKRILIQKWLAFITLFLGFVLFLSLCHALGALAAQKGSYVTAYLWQAFPIEAGISCIFMLIFSSIALIVSTFLSSKGVIGITFILGMSIVFTQFISQFTYSPPYKAVGITRNAPESLSPGSTSNFLYTRANALTNQDINSDINKANFTNMDFVQNNLYISDPDALNTYNHIWPFDLSYHINLMDSVVVKSVISQQDQAYKNFSGQVADGLVQKQVFDGYQNPVQLNKQYFMTGSDYTIMQVLINTFSTEKSNPDIANFWQVFSSLVNITNTWINHDLNTIKPTASSDASATYSIDITDGGATNSDAPFNNDPVVSNGITIRKMWKGLLRGTTDVNSSLTNRDNNDFTLENLFKKFGDNRFSVPKNDLDKQDAVDNNIFTLIMGYFQTKTIIASMDKVVQEIAQATSSQSEEEMDLSCYQYMKSGYQALSQVAHTLGKGQPVYNSDPDKIDWSSLENKIVQVKYVDFTNVYSVVAIYLAIAIILLPTAYFIIRRQDFS